MPVGLEFIQPDLQLKFQEGNRVVHRTLQHLPDTHKNRFLLFYYARIRRNGDLAISKSIECIEGLIRRYPGGQLYDYLHICCRIIVDLLDLYLSLFVGLYNRLNQGHGSFAKGDLCNDKVLLVQFFNPCTYFYGPAPDPVIIP